MSFSQMGSASFISAANGTSSPGSPEPKASHELLTLTQFVLLVLFCGSCHYVALIVSASAVGESTNILMLPFAVVKSLSKGLVTAVEKLVRRRQQHVFVGIEFEDDNAGFDVFDTVNRPTANTFR